jgi:hypothetical protein
MGYRLKLRWCEGKTPGDTRVVYFPGGFQLYVIRKDDDWRDTKQWRVWWGEYHRLPQKIVWRKVSRPQRARPIPEIQGLTDVWFKTRGDAQRAAENIFFPITEIAHLLLSSTTAFSIEGALKPRPIRKKAKQP